MIAPSFNLALGCACMLFCLVAVTSGAPVDEMMAIDPDQIVPEEVLTDSTSASTVPDWFKKSVDSIRVEDSAKVFTTKGLWDGIQSWDKANPEHAFFGKDEITNKAQLAAFLGNVAQETGGLKFPSELDHKTGKPCSIKKGNCKEKYGIYFGRGALQVTCWEGTPCANYLDLEKYFGVKDIKENPDQVATTPLLAWGSAIAYWTTNKGFGTLGPASKYPPEKDFGGTYATINGGQECPAPTGGNPEGVKDDRVANRVAKFKKACEAAGINCDTYNMKCPKIKLGICKKKNTWDCQNDAECGDMKPCEFVPKDQLPENKYNKKTCSGTADDCTVDSDCGEPVFCGPLKQGKCSNKPSKDCKNDAECSSIKCNCKNGAGKRCKENNDWGCKTDSDCGDTSAGAKCVDYCTSGGLCSNHPDWGCKIATDCGDAGYCGIPKGDRCSNHPGWACKAASDCDPPKCY